MSNTEEKKGIEGKSIPRNPNIPLKDSEVDDLLKKAAQQIADKPDNADKKSQQTTIPEFKKKEEKKEEKRENIDLKKDEVSSAKKEKDSKKKDLKEKKEEKKADKQEDEKKTDKKPVVAKEKSSEREEKKDTTKNNATLKEKDFKVEDDVYVATNKKSEKKPVQKNYKMTTGEIFGTVLEGVWIGVKLIVIVTILTAVVGFFMSRDLMIRGRSGEMLSTQNMNVAPAALSQRLQERKAGKAWNETVKKTKLTMESDDGKILVAQKIIVDKQSDDWVVILHGQGGNIEDVYDIAFSYAKEGYNILLPNLRAHGESEGSYYGMGWLDRLDVINWIDVVLEEHASADILIHGVGLGADTALMLSGEPLKDSIKAIIAEGAYTTAWEAVKKEYKERHPDWPVFPIMHMLNPVAKVWGGYSLKEADAVAQVEKAKIPILLIRGQNDTYADEEMAKELDAAIASEHELYTIATGTHEDCRFAEPDNYYAKVFEFAKKHLK